MDCFVCLCYWVCVILKMRPNPATSWMFLKLSFMLGVVFQL